MLRRNESEAPQFEGERKTAMGVQGDCRAAAVGRAAVGGVRMRRTLVAASAALALAGALFLAACATSTSPEAASDNSDSSMSAANGASSAYRKISAEEGQAMMEKDGVIVVDVRTAQEYADGHIPGAINIPVESIGDARPSALSDADASLIVYCRTGVRSKQASDKLIALGYTHVNDMGGIVDWHGDTVTGNEPGGK